ncbi:MAG TPA: hypothetical protein VH331_15720 [Allosphingosinicella sp.]|jgi:hypothetical protein|nr:hypothetical protein [Allosphingosinicella sp.]
MTRVRSTLLLPALLCGASALAGCSRGADPANNLAALDNQLVPNNADPAVTSAINDPILTDRNLSTQSNRNAVRSAGGPPQALYPPDSANTPAPPCAAAALDSNLGWAKRLPPEFPLYPGARVTEAAGTDAAPCRLRAVILATPDPWDRVIGWYQAQATRAGYATGRQARDGDQILAGTLGDQAFYLIASPKDGGSEISLIVGG